MRKRRSAEGSVSSSARRCTERRAGFFIYGVAAVNTAPATLFVHVRAVSQTFLYIRKKTKKQQKHKRLTSQVKSAVFILFYFLQTTFCVFFGMFIEKSCLLLLPFSLPTECQESFFKTSGKIFSSLGHWLLGQVGPIRSFRMKCTVL